MHAAAMDGNAIRWNFTGIIVKRRQKYACMRVIGLRRTKESIGFDGKGFAS